MQLAFGAAVVLLLLSGLAAYGAAVRLRTAQLWVSHTRDVQSTLADLNNTSSRAGRARTMYVDTGDDSFFQEYQVAAAEAASKLKHGRELTADNPWQQDNWSRLESVTIRRLGLLNNSVQLKRSGSLDGEQQARLRQQIIDVSAEADALLQTMQDEEQRLLDARRQQSERMFRITAYILCAAFVVALALFFFHYRLLNRGTEQPESRPRRPCALSVCACWSCKIRNAGNFPANFTTVSVNTWWV